MKLCVLAVCLILAVAVPACNYQPGPLPPIETYFSPKGGVTDAVVREIDAARQSIYVQAYSFTSAPIAQALVAARNRNVAIYVILDKSQRGEKYSSADFVANSGIPVLIDARHEIAHNKIMIIDGQTVITGSFNFTKQAETSNAENLLVIRDAGLAARYLENWHDHEAHSEAYAGRGADDVSIGDNSGGSRSGTHHTRKPR